MPTIITLPNKFIEDKNGSKFAPITTPNAVRFPDGTNLNDHLGEGSVIPVVLLSEPSTPKLGMVMFDAGETNKFYQYQLTGRWVEISTPHKAIGFSNNDDMYEIIDGVLSQTPIADLEDRTWYIFYTGGIRYPIGQVVFIDGYGGGVLPTNTDMSYWDDKQDAITFNSTYNATTNPAATMADVSSKEDKMSIVMMDSVISSLSPAINTLYNIIQASTLDVTLPTITDTTKVQSFVIISSFGGIAQSITIHGTQDNICIVYMPTDISLEAGKTYEINCMFCGQVTRTTTFNLWSVAIHDIGEVNPL